MRCGIDVGVTGALALLDDNIKLIEVVDMPVVTLKGSRREVNEAELGKIMEKWRRKYEGSLTAYVERVHTMPNQGVSSSGNFMMSYGVIRGALGALQIPFVLVTPHTWKKRAGLIGKEKDTARTKAQQLYPQAPLGRKKDIGRADAILIARFSQ
jgi:crossover junction endodeoxyribonuclease RuvC